MKIDKYTQDKYEIHLSQQDQKYVAMGHTIGTWSDETRVQFDLSLAEGEATSCLYNADSESYHIKLGTLADTEISKKCLPDSQKAVGLVKIVLEKKKD